MLSRTGIHALRAFAVLASLPEGEYQGAVSIARRIDAPQNYLGKLLQQFARDGLLEGRKGFGGGFRLARPAARVSLFDVVDPIEQLGRWEGCILGGESCNQDRPCALHDRFAAVRSDYIRMLRDTTLADLVENASPVDALAG